MNKTFKVAKSLTRGTVVTSEKASSYQGKAVKTVIAAAVALVAGAAMAESTAVSYEGKDLAVTTGQDVAITQDASKIASNGTITIDGGKATITNVNEVEADKTNKVYYAPSLNMTGGELVVKGQNNFYNLNITGGTVTVNGGDTESDWRAGTNIGGYAYVDEDGARQTLVAGSNTVVNVTNGMLWGGAQDSDPAIRKESKLLITDGAKVNLAGATVNKSGVLYVGTDKVMEIADSATVSVAEKQFGAIIAPTLNINGGTIENAGTLNLAFSNGKDSSNNNATQKLETSLQGAQASGMDVTITAGGINTAKTGTTNIKANVVLNGGAITNAGTTSIAGELNAAAGSVTNSGNLSASSITLGGDAEATASLTNTGVLTASSVTIGKNATVTTAISLPAETEGEPNTTSYAVASTTVNEGGTLEITQLNSEAIDGIVIHGNEQANTVSLTLDGGQVTHGGQVYQGNLKLGEDEYAANITFDNGDYKLNNLYFGKSSKVNDGSTLTVNADGSLTVANIEMSAGKITNEGTLNITGTVAVPTNASIDNTGVIYTSYTNLLAKDADETYTSLSSATDFGTAVKDDSGKVFDLAWTGDLTLTQFNAATTAVGSLVFLNANVVTDDGKAIEYGNIVGKELPNQTVAGTPGEGFTNSDLTTDQTKPTTVANVDTKTAETVNVKGQGELVLAGNNGTLFGASAKTVNVETGATLTLGYEYVEKSGTVNAKVVNNGTLNVAAGDFTAAGGIESAGKVVVNGDLTTAYITGAGQVNVDGGTLAILGNADEKADSGAVVITNNFQFGAPTDDAALLSLSNDTKKVSVLAFGADQATADAAVASYFGDDTASHNVVYLGNQITSASGVNVGVTQSGQIAAGDQADTVLIDLKSVAATKGFKAEDGVVLTDLENQGTVTFALLNLDGSALTGKSGEKTLKLAKSYAAAQGTSDAQAYVDYGTRFYGNSGKGTVAADGTVSFARGAEQADNDAMLDELMIGGLTKKALADVEFGTNQLVDTLVWGIDDYEEALQNSDTYKTLAKKDPKAASDYLQAQLDRFTDDLDIAAEMAIAGGAFGTALDINDQTTAAVDRRLSLANLNAPRAQGFTPWVDVYGTTNEAKAIYGGHGTADVGYSADIYGATLGFDYTASCGGVLGLAVHVGTADGQSEGLDSQVDNDVDYYGVSLYAAQQLGSFNVKADFGYTQTSNDLSMNAVFGNVKDSQDADLYTFGLGAEFLVNAGAVNVVPHAGLRWTSIDMDESKFGGDYDTMNVFQAPLGVAFSSTFETNGWKVAPMVDIAVVPTFGDKDAEVSYLGVKDSVRVIDSNPVQGTLGVEAQNGAFTFGLNYRLTAGSDDRMNNSFNANLRYAF